MVVSYIKCRYTGEDGFELSIPSAAALQVTETLMANEFVRMTGLGARDSLRLEAGLCLYGALLVLRVQCVAGKRQVVCLCGYKRRLLTSHLSQFPGGQCHASIQP